MASFRYRIGIPASQIKNPVAITQSPLGDADIYVFSKHWDGDLDHLTNVKGVTVYDICDDHFDHSKKGEHYHNMATMADHVTCNSETMAKIIEEKTGRKATVIPDPFESPYGQARFNGNKPKLCWFGHPTNIHTIQNLDLSSVGHLIGGLEVVTMVEEKRAVGNVIYTPWSLGAQRRAICDADIIILPQDKMAKSANRLIESLRLGRFVCANPIPSYEEFAPYTAIGDICDGMRWATEFPEEVLHQIKSGQAYIDQNYSPKVIGERWKKLFDSI
jgi:hypothetical protein